MASIEVDEQVFAAIQGEAVPLVDTANDVLRRKYGLDTSGQTATVSTTGQSKVVEGPAIERLRRRRTRRLADRDDRTPQNWYGRPLLETLVALGGGGHADAVQEKLFEDVGSRLTRLDLEQLDSGEYRWRKDVQWMRQKLADRGLISRERRGYWEITDAGRRALEEDTI